MKNIKSFKDFFLTESQAIISEDVNLLEAYANMICGKNIDELNEANLGRESIVDGFVFDDLTKFRRFFTNPHNKIKYSDFVNIVYMVESFSGKTGRVGEKFPDAQERFNELDPTAKGYHFAQEWMESINGWTKKNGPRRNIMGFSLKNLTVGWDVVSYEKKSAERVALWNRYKENQAAIDELIQSPDWEVLLASYENYYKKKQEPISDEEHTRLLTAPTIEDVEKVLFQNKSLKTHGKYGYRYDPNSRIKQHLEYAQAEDGTYTDEIAKENDFYIDFYIPAGNDDKAGRKYFILTVDNTLEEIDKEVYNFLYKVFGSISSSKKEDPQSQIIKDLQEIDSSFAVNLYKLSHIASMSFKYTNDENGETNRCTFINKDLAYAGDEDLGIPAHTMTEIIEDLIAKKWRKQ